MKNNDSDRELEERLSSLRPQPTSPEFERKLIELTRSSSEQKRSFAIAGNRKWNLTVFGLATAAVAVVVFLSIALLWPQKEQVDQPEMASKTSNSIDFDPGAATIADFNLAINRGDDIEDMLNRHCNSTLPTHPLSDVSLHGATGFFKQNY